MGYNSVYRGKNSWWMAYDTRCFWWWGMRVCGWLLAYTLSFTSHFHFIAPQTTDKRVTHGNNRNREGEKHMCIRLVLEHVFSNEVVELFLFHILASHFCYSVTQRKIIPTRAVKIQEENNYFTTLVNRGVLFILQPEIKYTGRLPRGFLLAGRNFWYFSLPCCSC